MFISSQYYSSSLVVPIGSPINLIELRKGEIISSKWENFLSFEQVRGNPLPSGGGRIARTPEASF
jgi:hypothetical protein